MQELIDRLGSLGDSTGVPSPATVGADLRRGRAELSRRRRRQGAAGLVVATAMALAGVSAAAASSGTREAHAQSTGSVVKVPSDQVSTQLVAYTGHQLAGFTVSEVPAGYVLQGAQPTTLDIAAPDDHTPIDSFVDKLIVSLQSHNATTPTAGRHVVVDGQPGIIDEMDGVRTLTYKDGKYEVNVQCWSNIHLTNSQLVAFAAGVTVTSGAQQPNG
jgi:hypothetical protein